MIKNQDFSSYDLADFWDDTDYSQSSYTCLPPNDELICEMEKEFGYKLPASYIALMQMQNGGTPIRTCFPTTVPTSWAEDHIAISGIMGIGREKFNSLGGVFGSRTIIEEWGFPSIGVAICHCPSGGHDVIMLDYRKCGPEGEPEVVHVEGEPDRHVITFLAKDFLTFIQGLVHEEVYDTREADKAAALDKVRSGAFSPLLSELCRPEPPLPFQPEQTFRKLGEKLVEKKSSFSLHSDEDSLLMYDLQFLLYTIRHPQTTRVQFFTDYEFILVFAGEFKTGGYAKDFVHDWMNERIALGLIVEAGEQIAFSDAAKEDLLERLQTLIY